VIKINLLAVDRERAKRKAKFQIGQKITVGCSLILVVAAIIGVISPSGNEIGPFLSLEQAALSQLLPSEERTRAFAWYNLAGSLATASGALCGGFLSQGLWHAGLGYGVGWTFLVWGALNGAYQWGGVATRPLWRRLGERLPRVRDSAVLAIVRALLTFHLIAVSWVFFRAKSVGDAWVILRKIAAHLADMPSLLTRYPFTVAHYTGFALIALLVGVEILDERRSIFQRLSAAPVAVRWGLYYLAIVALLVLGRWQSREFIYMQF